RSPRRRRAVPPPRGAASGCAPVRARKVRSDRWPRRPSLRSRPGRGARRRGAAPRRPSGSTLEGVNPTPRDHDRRPGDGEQETPPPTGTADSPFDDHTAPLAAAGPDPAPPSAPGPDDQTPPAADPEPDPGEADGLAWSRSGTPA